MAKVDRRMFKFEGVDFLTVITFFVHIVFMLLGLINHYFIIITFCRTFIKDISITYIALPIFSPMLNSGER